MRTLIALCSVLVFSGCVVVVAPDGDNGRIETNWSSKNIESINNSELIYTSSKPKID